jgi:hypothetical protein
VVPLRGFLLAIAHGLRFAGFAIGARFGRRFRLGDTTAQARFVSPHFAELLLTLLNGGFQAGEGLFTLVARLLQLACWARCSYTSVCCWLCFSSSIDFCTATSSRVFFSWAMVSWRAWFR